MKILKNVMTVGELRSIAKDTFGDMVKAVVDVDRRLVSLDGELHSDLEAILLENGSEQKALWGINFYPDLEGDDLIEFDSMINLRPSQGNNTRSVDSADIRRRIIDIVNEWIKK